MATCPLCDKQFKDRRGLHGHFRFVHGIEYGSGRPAKKTALTEATKRIVERRKKESELIDEIKQGKYVVIPRSEVVPREKTAQGSISEAKRSVPRAEDIAEERRLNEESEKKGMSEEYMSKLTRKLFDCLQEAERKHAERRGE